MAPTKPTMDALDGFSVESLFAFTAPYGSAAPSNATADVAGYTYVGDTDIAAGFTLSLPTVPDKTVVKSFRDGGTTFFTSRQITDDLPTIKASFVNTKASVINTLLGVTIDGTGKTTFANHVKPPISMYFDLWNQTGDVLRLFFPRAAAALDGDLSASGSDRLLRWPGSFEADLDGATGYQMAIFSPFFIDHS